MVASHPDLCLAELGGVEVANPPRKQRRASGIEAEVLARCRELAQGPAARVGLDRLRSQMQAERYLLDEALLRLEGEGRIVLVGPLFPNHLSGAEREALLEHPDGEARLFAELVLR